MRVFHVWVYDRRGCGPTGPWIYLADIRANSENEAIETAKQCYNETWTYRVYPSL